MTAALLAGGLIVTGMVDAKPPQASTSPAGKTSGEKPVENQQFKITRVSLEYWRVAIDHPPFNIQRGDSIAQLNTGMTQIETVPKLKVAASLGGAPVVFLTHYHFEPSLEQTASMALGLTGLLPPLHKLVRLDRGPIVMLMLPLGRTIRVGGELTLASEIRFAGCEKAVLLRLEIGAGFVPGGGPMAGLPRQVAAAEHWTSAERQ